jgi:excisionase family DNA binding protein
MDTEMTAKHAAEQLGITVQAVHKAIRLNRLPARRLGNQYLITESAVAAYRAETQPQGEKSKGRPPGRKDGYARHRRKTGDYI